MALTAEPDRWRTLAATRGIRTLEVLCPVRAMACYGHRGETTMNRAARGDGPLLSSDQLSRFQHDGYLLVEGVLEPAAVVEPLFVEYREVLDRLAHELCGCGELASTYADFQFAERLIRIYRETGRDHSRYFDPSLMTSGVTPDTPYWAGPAVFHIITHERVLDLVECLIGPEIYSNPVQHIRIKPPEYLLPDGATDVLARANPWHQDNGVVEPVADDTSMLTVWIALSDAPVERGCLQVIPRSHLQELRTHCPGKLERPFAIPDALLEIDRATPRSDARGRRDPDAQAHHPRLPSQCQRTDPLEPGPALQPDRPADRPPGVPRVRGAQQTRSGA